MYLTYKITCIPTGKIYYGYTSTSLEKRWIAHKSAALTETIRDFRSFHAAIVKYGPENFTVEKVKAHPTKESALAHEVFLITEGQTNRNRFPDGIGLNLTDGGEVAIPHTEDAKRRISEALKGRAKSDDHKRKMSEARTGMTLTDEHKRKIGDSLRGTTYKPMEVTEEFRAARSKASTGRVVKDQHKSAVADCLRGRTRANERIVAQYTNGTQVVFVTAKEAAAHLGISEAAVSEITKGKRRQRDGYTLSRVTLV